MDLSSFLLGALVAIVYASIGTMMENAKEENPEPTNFFTLPFLVFCFLTWPILMLIGDDDG